MSALALSEIGQRLAGASWLDLGSILAPGSEAGPLLAARLSSLLIEQGGSPTGLVTIDGFSQPAAAIEQARLATRLGLPGVLIDAGVFAAGNHERDPLQLATYPAATCLRS